MATCARSDRSGAWINYLRKSEEDEDWSEAECARALDATCGWRSAEVRTARYLYLHSFTHKAALHAELAPYVLVEAASGMLEQFVRHEEEPLPAPDLVSLLRDDRVHFQAWVLERLIQM